MKLLYSDILPLKLPENKSKFLDHFSFTFQQADEIKIAVGYASKAALKELKELIKLHPEKKIYIILGMYYIPRLVSSCSQSTSSTSKYGAITQLLRNP